MEFEWDQQKEIKNIKKHGVGFLKPQRFLLIHWK